VIEVGSFAWLVPQSSLDILAAEDRIGLQSLLIEQKLAPIDISLTLESYVDKFKTSTLPEVVAGVNKLIDSPIEASFFGQLSVCKPLNQPIEVEFVFLSKD
jgi:hypothetical protein